MGAEAFISEGKVENHTVVSVPPSMSLRALQDLMTKLSETLTQPVIVVTHNVHFLRVKKLSKKAAEEVQARMEEQHAKADASN